MVGESEECGRALMKGRQPRMVGSHVIAGVVLLEGRRDWLSRDPGDHVRTTL